MLHVVWDKAPVPPPHLPLKPSAGLEDQRKTPPLHSTILLDKKYFYCINMCVCVYTYISGI